MGQKLTVINYMKRNENHGGRGNITPTLTSPTCQDFLQSVKPVREIVRKITWRLIRRKISGYNVDTP